MPTARKIVVLEDDARRRAEMTSALDAATKNVQLVFVDNAPDFSAAIADLVSGASLICLDHDLGPNRIRDGRTFDPGIGRDVTRLLATMPPTCPIIIHSTNVAGAQGMRQDLVDAGWNVSCIAPYDDLRWVREAWVPEVMRVSDIGGAER